jgi:hypothetical protein
MPYNSANSYKKASRFNAPDPCHCRTSLKVEDYETTGFEPGQIQIREAGRLRL